MTTCMLVMVSQYSYHSLWMLCIGWLTGLLAPLSELVQMSISLIFIYFFILFFNFTILYWFCHTSEISGKKRKREWLWERGLKEGMQIVQYVQKVSKPQALWGMVTEPQHLPTPVRVWRLPTHLSDRPSLSALWLPLAFFIHSLALHLLGIHHMLKWAWHQ